MSHKIEQKEVVILGGGLMGSSAAWHLSNSFDNVLLLENQNKKYTSGSSLGEARISRSIGPKKDIFSYLQQSAVEETKKLIAFLNIKDEKPLHKMEDIYSTSPVTYVFYNSQQNEIDALIVEQSIKFEHAKNKEEAESLFDISISESKQIIREFKEYSGTLNPRVLIEKLHLAIELNHGEICYESKITDINRRQDGYEVRLLDNRKQQSKTIYTKKIVSAMGPYTGKMLSSIAPYFKELIQPERVFLFFYKIEETKYNSLGREQKEKINSFFPVADFSPEIMFAMVDSYNDKSSPTFKIGAHFLRSKIDDLDEIWLQPLSENELNWGINKAYAYFQMLKLPIEKNDIIVTKDYSCVYSISDSEIPYVTPILDKKREADSSFVVLGGMSGIGAKGSLAYGRIAADLILGENGDAELYQKAKSALGFERLLQDLSK